MKRICIGLALSERKSAKWLSKDSIKTYQIYRQMRQTVNKSLSTENLVSWWKCQKLLADARCNFLTDKGTSFTCRLHTRCTSIFLIIRLRNHFENSNVKMRYRCFKRDFDRVRYKEMEANCSLFAFYKTYVCSVYLLSTYTSLYSLTELCQFCCVTATPYLTLIEWMPAYEFSIFKQN